MTEGGYVSGAAELQSNQIPALYTIVNKTVVGFESFQLGETYSTCSMIMDKVS